MEIKIEDIISLIRSILIIVTKFSSFFYLFENHIWSDRTKRRRLVYFVKQYQNAYSYSV